MPAMIIIFFSVYLHHESKILDAIVDYSNCILLGSEAQCNYKREDIAEMSIVVVTLIYHTCYVVFAYITPLLFLRKNIANALRNLKCTKNLFFLRTTDFISSSNNDILVQLGIL